MLDVEKLDISVSCYYFCRSWIYFVLFQVVKFKACCFGKRFGGTMNLACHCGCIHLKVYPTSRWTGARRAQSSLKDPFLQPLSLWPRVALSARPPLFVPAAERAAPMSPLERNEKKERIAAVTWALLFHSSRSPWQRGRSWKHAAPLSGQRPEGREAAGSFSSRSLLTASRSKVSSKHSAANGNQT